MQRFQSALVACAVGAWLSLPAQAEACQWPTTPNQGDHYAMWDLSGWKCKQVFVNYWWSAFSMDEADWDNGYGYEAPCDNVRPLARTFNGLYVLGYSSTGTPSCNTSQSNITLWAQCWSASQIDELDGRCPSASLTTGNAALTKHGDAIDNWTQLYWPFFYGMDVSVRAASIFHEARHASGCTHNGGTRCRRGSSCDQSYGNGCKEPRSNGDPRQGSNEYEVNYLIWFAQTGWRATSSMKTAARNRANSVLQDGFEFDPCIRIADDNSTYWSC